MRNLMLLTLGCFLTVVGFSYPGCAQARVKNYCSETGQLLSNDLSSNRTFTVPNLMGYKILSLGIDYTHDTNGTITVTCTGESGGVAGFSLTTCTVGGGACTLNWSGVVVTPDLSGNKKYSFPLGISGEKKLTCIVSHSGVATVDDDVIIHGRKCVQ